MKLPALHHFRQKLAADQSVYGLWVTLESASVTEMAVESGLDWVVIDAEHGHLDWNDILQHIRATVRSETVALVRISEISSGLIKRVLDIGADGVVVPWVETKDQLERVVLYARYPPDGLRGIGAERATGWGSRMAEHVDDANENVLIVPVIESVGGGQAIRELVTVDGVDVFYFGPADYSSSAGYAGQWEGPGVAEQILAAKDVIRESGKNCGVVATGPDNMRQRVDQGFRMIGFGMDSGLILKGIRGWLDETERIR